MALKTDRSLEKLSESHAAGPATVDVVVQIIVFQKQNIVHVEYT
jgi:hypothetical protein